MGTRYDFEQTNQIFGTKMIIYQVDELDNLEALTNFSLIWGNALSRGLGAADYDRMNISEPNNGDIIYCDMVHTDTDDNGGYSLEIYKKHNLQCNIPREIRPTVCF